MSAQTVNIITVMLLFALGSVLATVIWLLVKGGRSSVTYTFVGCQTSQLLWIISQLMILLSESEKQLSLSYGIGNLGISFIGSCWLLFAVSYMDMELSKPLVATALGISAAIFLSSASNPLHKLYYTEFGFDKITHGVLFYISQVYTYITIIFGIILVCKKCFENKERSRGQAVLLTFATGIPLVINLLTLLNVISIKLSLTPISLSASGILVLFATYRFGFLNVNEVAFEDALNNIGEGVIIFNRLGRITYLNSTAGKQLDISEKTDYSALVRNLSENTGKSLDESFDYTETEKNGLTLGIRHYLCRDGKGTAIAQTMIISDITRYYQLIEKTDELNRASERLALERERNRIAGEVHDTAGHTFTMISSLAKLSGAKLANSPDFPQRDDLIKYANETESLARGGLTELRCSINNLREENFMTSVSSAVKTVTDALREIKTEVCIQGTEDGRTLFCVQNIYSSFRELITNSVRYSGADRIDVILKFLDSSLELYVFDNGRGCKEINAHNGLKGITERTEALGGTAVFRSGDGIGFTAVIKIPLPESKGEKK